MEKNLNIWRAKTWHYIFTSTLWVIPHLCFPDPWCSTNLRDLSKSNAPSQHFVQFSTECYNAWQALFLLQQFPSTLTGCSCPTFPRDNFQYFKSIFRSDACLWNTNTHSQWHTNIHAHAMMHTWTQTHTHNDTCGDGDSSEVRAPDSRLKGPGFKSL